MTPKWEGGFECEVVQKWKGLRHAVTCKGGEREWVGGVGD